MSRIIREYLVRFHERGESYMYEDEIFVKAYTRLEAEHIFRKQYSKKMYVINGIKRTGSV